MSFEPHVFHEKQIEAIDTQSMSRDEWLGLRNSLVGLGGSDIGVIMGLNEYKSPTQLFYEKVGYVQKDISDNIFMFMGRLLEDRIMELFMCYDGTEEGMMMNHEQGVVLRVAEEYPYLMRDPKIPHLFANIDGKITSDNFFDGVGILEIKTISGYASDKWEHGLPPSYISQLQHYMFVTGAEWGYIAAIRDGRHYHEFPFEASKDFQDAIIELSEDFMERVSSGIEIVKGEKSKRKQLQALGEIAPEPDYSAAYEKFISDLYNDRGDWITIDADHEVTEWISRYKDEREKEKEHAREKQLYCNRIKAVMGKHEAKRIKSPAGSVSWNKKFFIR